MYTSRIPALGRCRQEDHEFKAILGSVARPCLKKPKIPKNEILFKNKKI
jgi:hypothetical protein